MPMLIKPADRWEAYALRGYYEPITGANKARIFFLTADYDPFTPLDQWQATFSWPFGTNIYPTTPNGHFYTVVAQATAGGSSGSSEPTWPTDGGEVTDGDLTWRDSGQLPPHPHDTAFADWDAGGFTNFLYGITPAEEWQASTAYSAKDVVKKTTNDGEVMIAETSGTTGGTEPTWPVDGGNVVDGGVTWQNIGYNPGAFCLPSSGSYVFDSGIEIPGSDIESGLTGFVSQSISALRATQLSMDSVGWIGETLKWGVIVCQTTGIRANTLGYGNIDELWNPMIAVVDLDTGFPSGFLIQSGGTDSLILDWPDGPDDDEDVLLYLDHTS